MTIRHLRIFIEVVSCGKMSLAAQKLYISQPTVSQAVAEIESMYHVRLFERLSKRLYLTPEGTILLGYARRVVALFDEMEERLCDAGRAIRLRVGATVTVGTCILGDLIRILNQKYPQIDTEVLVDNTHAVEEGILSSTLDVGIVEGRVHSSDIVCEPIIGDRLVLVCGGAHPLAREKSVSLNSLRAEPFILRERGSGTRELFESMMKKQGGELRCKWVCNNSEAIKNAVIANLGLSVISIRLVEKEAREGLLHIVEIKNCPMRRDFSLMYHKNKYLSDYFLFFLKACREYGAQAGI